MYHETCFIASVNISQHRLRASILRLKRLHKFIKINKQLNTLELLTNRTWDWRAQDLTMDEQKFSGNNRQQNEKKARQDKNINENYTRELTMVSAAMLEVYYAAAV